MKIDINKIKKGTSEVPPECQAIIQKLKTCYQDNNNENLLQELQQTTSWTYGKCELFHWVDVLNIFDDILEHGARRITPGLWSLAADTYNKKSRDLLLEVLRFTTLLIEHSFSRHLYNSMEHLLVLMGSSNLEILNGVLNLLYMFSKRSNFIPRLHQDSKSPLLKYLMYLAESWGGRENGFGLASCCQEVLKPELRESATTLHFEYYDDTPTHKNKVTTIHIENIDKIDKSLSSIMDELIETYNVIESQRMVLFTQLRLAHGFPCYHRRLLCVQARLQAISVLAYSNGLQDNTHQAVLYNGLLEELVELLELSAPELVDIRAAALRTLTSVIHLDRNPHFPKKPGPRLLTIIDVTGAANYHGQLPSMVRTCIASLTGTQPHEQARVYGAQLQSFPLPLATALFSFLYHLASYEAGGEALVSCGMMESLLKVINWPGENLDQITFVTRAVRVIDLIANIDMTSFQAHQGLASFINRLELEVNICRKEQPFEIRIPKETGEAMHDSDAETPGPSVPPAENNANVWRNREGNTLPTVNESNENQMLEEPTNSSTAENEEGVRWTQPDFPSSSPSQNSTRPTTSASEIEGQASASTSQEAETDVTMAEDEEKDETWAPKIVKIFSTPEENAESAMEIDEENTSKEEPSAPVSTANDTVVNEPQPGTSASTSQYSNDLFERTSKVKESVDYSGNRWQDAKTGKTCLPERAGLIKSILNFLKKAIQDQTFNDTMRTVMEGSLPSSLKHVISNSDYYGPYLFLLATDVVTVYIFQEPSLLSTLQDNYLTDVVLQAMLVKEVPATREVLASLPNVISALCLNSRGLAQFKQFHSFDHLCEIFVHPLYLPAMRRRRSNDPLGDTATTLGNAMDALMRHHPDLKTEAMKAVINLLDEIYVYGTSPQYTCESYTSKKTSTSPDPPATSNNDGGGSSDEEEDEEKEAPSTSYYVRADASQGKPHTPIPLIDYIHNVMKFVDAILSNNSTEDHCKEFVALGGLKYTVKLLSMPNLPADYAVTPAAQAVANVCKSILSLAREPKVLEEGLKELQQVLTRLEPLTDHSSGKCVLLHELAMVPDLDNALYSYTATPLLHSMAATHGFVIMFVHVCRTGQSEMRNTSIYTWGSALGLDILHKLSKLYTSLVWESTLLLALCSDDVIPSDCDFGQQDLNLLLPQKEGRLIRTTTEAMNTMKVESPSPSEVGEGTSFMSSTKSKATRIAPTPEQLKHLKLLLGAASRLGRALAELFGLLVKLCVGSPKRRVTFQQQTFSYPALGATDVAKAMSDLLARGLNWNLVPPAPLEKFKLTYLICSVGFTSPMLFDDKKQPYHMIMHYFVEGENDGSSSGLMAFFDSMYHALAGDGSSESEKETGKKEFPEGTGEFLDAWLMLLEKMTNPKMILDSPNVFVQEHKVENAPVLEFCPYRYLVKIHRMAFNAIMEMWCRKPLKGYGFRMTDSMLRILKHILVGEKILQERLEEASAKQISLTTYGDHVRGGAGYGNQFSNSPLDGSFPFQGFSSSTPNPHVQVNEALITQLCDMGFSRDAAIEALSQSRSIEMAIGYLVENNRTSYEEALRDIEQDLSEVFGASSIEVSNSVLPREGSSSGSQANPGHSQSMSQGDGSSKAKKKWRCEMPLAEREAEMMNEIKKYQLSQDTMNKFTENALAQCLEVLENLPETVYRVCDLLMVISDRNGFPWCENMLEVLCKDISTQVINMLKEMNNDAPVTLDRVQQVLVDSDNAKKVSVRLHLLTLLFDDLRFACVRAMSHTCLICFLIQLLEMFGKHSDASGNLVQSSSLLTPKWVAPLVLLLDLYEKTAVYTQRMHEMHKACIGVWKWFQIKTGKWTVYTSQNNKLINLAYWSGAPGCRVTVGETRRKYHINFNTLLQINEDTNRGSPITMVLRQPEEDTLAAEMTGNDTEKEKNKEYESIYNQAHNRSQHPIASICESDRFIIMEACVKLMQIPVDADALHALMRLTLRLTRDYTLAKFFSQKGGVTALLNLEQDSNFIGFSSLATLILRHVMEDPITLRTALERTIRGRISTEIQPFFRELLFMMRHSEAGICRNPEIYFEIAQKNLQIEYCDTFEGRFILKYVRKNERNEEPTIEKTAVSLIRTLLNQLVVPDEYLLKSYSEASVTNVNINAKEPATVHPQNKFFSTDLDAITNVLNNKKPVENKEKEKKEFPEEKKSRKLLSKSAILAVLTDAVKSYMGFSKLIMDHVYEADPENPVLTEDMTAIRFILEKFVLLPGVDKESLEIAAEARVLLGAVGACNHSAGVQSALVMEVKNCIQRIVSSHYEDTKKKYTDVSCILSLISDMMVMCPPVNWLSIVNNSFIKMKNNVAHLSNISKLFTRKGLINELARLPHNLDLSNPNFVLAMNAALKPLETLTKLANDRGNRNHGGDSSYKTGGRQNASNRTTQEVDPTLTNSSGTTSGNTNAQGEEANEDTENTENDLSAAAESLEPVSDSQVNDDITDIGEIVLEDQNMDSRDADRGSSMHMEDIVIPQDRETVENDDLSNPMTLQTALMQMTSEMVHGLITELQPSNQEQLTDPDDPDNLEEDQYGDEQMEEDNNEVDEGGYNNENDDPDDDFLMDTTIFNRPEHIVNDLLFVQYPSNESETLGTFNEFYSDDSSLRPEESVLQNPPPIYHPLLVRRNREDSVPLRNIRSRPRRYQFLQLNPQSRSLSNRPDILQNLLFSQRGYRSADYRQGDQHGHNSGNHHFRNSNLVLMENGFGMLTRPDEDNVDLLDQSMEYYFGQHLSSNVQSVCYARWASEMKILDADSAAMAATVLSSRLREVLEIHKDDIKGKQTSSHAMDVSSPPNTSENKNVEMTDAAQQNNENSVDEITQLPTQPADENVDSARTEDTASNQESSRLAEESSSPSANRTTAESNIVESEQLAEAGGDSNLRDAFTSYFMFDDDERVESAFPIYETNEEMADDEDGTETRDNFDLNSASQETENDLPFLGWDSHPRADDGLPLRRIPGSISIVPTLVPPAVYPLLSSPQAFPEVDNSLEISSNVTQADESSNNASSATNANSPSSLSGATSAQNTNSNSETNQETENETENTESTSSRPSNMFPDFLPSIFGQSTENQERASTSEPQPAPAASENDNATTGAPESEAAAGSSSTSTTANANENASPVPLDPEEMIQLYPNGRATYRGISIPAGLDPSFLAALPSEMREEVFSNHLRQQSLQRAESARDSTPPSSSNTDEVNPEFLAALPLNIQEEVLAQQRHERQRQVAANTNHNDPFDAAAFFQNLPSSLRQSILADMEESQISVLPPDLAAEAQNLRREQDARNRQYVQERERILNHNTLSSILRGTGPRATRVTIRQMRSQWGIPSISRGSDTADIEPNFESSGRQLLDQEAVSTLLVLLFVQDFRLNISRLHRVIRNLCCHPPTRDFVRRTLISIMEKCNESRSNPTNVISRQSSPKRKMPRSSHYASQSSKGTDSELANQSTDPEPTWLNLSMDAALGCRANVFQVQLKRYGKRSLDNYLAHSVSIHPQAAPIVFRNAMDLLYTLTKVFINECVPKKPKDNDKVEDASASKKPINTAFWDILVRLENLNSGKYSKKGKSALKNQTSTPFNDVEPRSSSFDKSLMGHLVTMLTYPLVRASTQLTDKLLHILNLVSEGFSELDEEEAVPVTEEHLKIIVNVLTSNGCSENGLEQATNLLINWMSNCPDPTRLTSLKLLISGAQDVAALVKQHIEALLNELRVANAKARSDELEVEMKDSHRKGQIQDSLRSCCDRQDNVLTITAAAKAVETSTNMCSSTTRCYNQAFTKKSVIITAPSKVKGGFDIQLPAMQPLISKTSSQSFFLRILKVIIQLREVLVIKRNIETARRKKDKDKKAAGTGGQSNSNATTEQNATPRRRLVTITGVLDPDDNSLISLYNANDGNDDGARSAASSMSVDLELFDNNGQPAENTSDREEGNDQTVVDTNADSNETAASDSTPKPGDSDATMETDTEKDSQGTKGGDEKENAAFQIPSLTKQLQLDDLWIILSECLTELEKTPDHHAALILQPAVEAFFLVHSTAISECRALTDAGVTTTVPTLPRRARGDGPLPLMPIFPGFDFGVSNILERSQPSSNVLVSVAAPNVPSSSIQGSSQQSRTRQNNSFGHIITEYRRFVQALGVANRGPLSVDVDSENAGAESSAGHSDLDSTSLAAFFKETENSPLLDPFKFLRFAELHRSVLNQILRQSTIHLPDGPFAILVNFTRVLDFDVKRKYFRQELEKMHDGSRRGDETAVNVNRSHVFEESFRELHRKSPEEWKNKFYVVFESEEGQDAGGLLREWYMIISREIFNPDYALFTVSPGDRVTYTINPSSHCNPNHLLYFKFVGRLIAKAIYDSKYLECYFTRSFYKHILGIPVKYQDMESEDPEFYEGLVYLKNHKVSELGNDLTFTTDVQEFGVTESRELKPNGANIPVTDENKMDYIHLVCQMKMTGAIRKQLDAFLEGFYEIIPKHLISIFNEQELELLISGLPNIDIDDLKNNTEYNKYSRNSIQIVWFWRALREMDSQDQAKFLQFVTGTSKVPLQGFSALEGMNGIQKFQIHRDDRSTDRLPSAHTCFNQLDLPAYETYTKLKNNLLKAIHECSEGFGFV